MIEIKFHKNEIDYLKDAVSSSVWFGDNPKLGEKLLNKLKKTTSEAVVQKEVVFCGGYNKNKCNIQCYGCEVDESI